MDTGLQLIQIERLDQIIVRPGVQSSDTIGNLIMGRQNDYRRDVLFEADLLENVQTAAIRQPEIQKHKAVIHPCQTRQSAFLVFSQINSMVVPHHVRAHSIREDWIIFHKQNTQRRFISFIRFEL